MVLSLDANMFIRTRDYLIPLMEVVREVAARLREVESREFISERKAQHKPTASQLEHVT